MIPAFNEEGAIGDVVHRARVELHADVVVIDDGSTDNTGQLARKAGAVVLRHCFNLGVGAAIRTGLRYADMLDYGVVLQLDGDGQHEPAEAWALLDQLDTGVADIAIG